MLRALIALPFLIVLVLFGLSNRGPVTLKLWPTGWQLEAPTAIVILVAMAGAFVLGALFVWLPALGIRRRARRLERETQRLEAEVAALKADVRTPGTAMTER
jgi:lipopolysaccharide assembly protein A